MGAYYLDTNGATAGFGTLTANVNGTVWSTNAAGTSATTTRTFTGSADEMNFGSTSVASTTVGTLTLNVNASVYAVRTKNLTGAQTIAGSSTLTLSRADGVPVLDLGNDLGINAPLAGTQGFDAFGSAIVLRNLSNPISGTLTGPLIFLDPASGDTSIIPNASVVTSNLFLTLPKASTYSFGRPISNVSSFGRWQINPGPVPLTGTVSSDMSGTLGTGVDNDGGLSVGPRAGLAPFGTGAGLHTVNFSGTLPSQVNYYFNYGSSTQAYGIVINYSGTQTNYLNTCLALVPNTATQNRLEFNANQTSGGLTLGGGIQKYGPSGLTLTMKLGGTSVSDNTISGVISQTQTALAIEKIGATRWIFTNANTYTGGTTISGGALRATNNAAFGTGNITLSSGTMELAGVSITGSTTTAVNTLGTISAVSGVNSLSSDITLAGTTTVDVAGTSLTLSGLITGSTAFNKTGTGLATLSNNSNSFTSSPSINAGTLAVASIAASGTASALGAGTGLTLSGSGVLRYTGSTGTTLSRTLTAGSITGGFENNGSGSLAIAAAAGSITGTSTVKLGGTGAGQYNTLGVTVAGGGFTKEGPGRWIFTASNNLSGTTTVSAGTLMAANADGATKKLLGGNVTVAAGAKIQTGSDNDQKGRNNYTSLTFAGTSGNPAKLRIGGSAVSPTVQMSGNLTISGAVTWDLTADTFKTPGTYTLIEFVSGSLVGSLASVTITTPTGRIASNLTYNTPVGGPNTITVQIS